MLFYRCTKRVAVGQDTCSQRKYYRADKVESQVWELVSDLMKDPEQLRDDLQRMVEHEREGLY